MPSVGVPPQSASVVFAFKPDSKLRAIRPLESAEVPAHKLHLTVGDLCRLPPERRDVLAVRDDWLNQLRNLGGRASTQPKSRAVM